MRSQLSDCCKAIINFYPKLERPDCYKCSVCNRVIGSPIHTMPPNTPNEIEAIDHERFALIQAIKSMIPPPYMLQVEDIEALRQSGRTGATALIENEQRSREYEITIERVYKYITQLNANRTAEMEAIRQDFKFVCGVIGHLKLKFGDENEVVKEMTNYISKRDEDTIN